MLSSRFKSYSTISSFPSTAAAGLRGVLTPELQRIYPRAMQLSPKSRSALSRRLAVLGIAAFCLFSGPAPALAACSTACTKWRTQTEICSECCRTCINQRGETTFEGCDTVCVYL